MSAAEKLYKTLRNGRSWHGGEHEWSLPTQGADETWTPGEWTPRVTPRVCSEGWHLTTEPARWWSADEGVACYLAEHDGAVSRSEGEDKIACERVRLLRPLTEDELAAVGIYTRGEHKVSSGSAWASGSATVEAWDSATVRASGSATVEASGSAAVEASGSATVRASGSATVRASGSATVEAWDSATVEASGSATVRASGSATVEAWGSATVGAWDSATVEAWDSATVEAWDSATVEAWGSAKAHAGGRSTCIAWRGTTLVLTRSDAGVIVDRRGAAPKTYTKRAGLDGWRFRGGKWVHVKVRAKAGAP